MNPNPNRKTLIIEVSGGCVQAVLCDGDPQQLSVWLADFDDRKVGDGWMRRIPVDPLDSARDITLETLADTLAHERQP